MISFSVLIVTHAREELLMKCLESLRVIQGEWKLILVANGAPLSEEILQAAKSITSHFQLVETDSTLLPGKARNLGLSAKEGEWVFFLDDDAFIYPSYWEKVSSFLQDSKIDVLGGPDTSVKGMSVLAHSVSLALSSPFCTGPTFMRHKSSGKVLQHASEEMLTSCNLWVRTTLLNEDVFPEHYRRTEENYFLLKLKEKGASLFYHPQLVVGHHRRGKIKDLIRPTFYAGFCRSLLMREEFGKGSKIFWLPGIFVVLHLIVFFSPEIFIYLARMYISLILFMSIALAMKARRMAIFPLVAFMHYFIVFLYGAGFLTERIRKGRK